jgi:hypothetical protein
VVAKYERWQTLSKQIVPSSKLVVGRKETNEPQEDYSQLADPHSSPSQLRSAPSRKSTDEMDDWFALRRSSTDQLCFDPNLNILSMIKVVGTTYRYR